jgi:membrane protein
MTWLWNLGGLSWKKLCGLVWKDLINDDVMGRSAQLSYYFLLALFPLLLFLVTLFGYFADRGSELRNSLLRYLGTVIPYSATTLIHTTLDGIAQEKGGFKLSFGILAAFWAASNGMSAISETLNVAYKVKETRAWWKVRLISMALTVALALLIIAALVLVLMGSTIAERIAAIYGYSALFTYGWSILQWPLVFFFVLMTFNLIYYFAPDLRGHQWRWVTPGAIIGIALWLLVSFGFRIYLHFFNSYDATYGSLGALIILMLWFYLTGAAILIGGEVNSEIENAAAKAGAPDAKESGEKAPNEKEKKAARARRK